MIKKLKDDLAVSAAGEAQAVAAANGSAQQVEGNDDNEVEEDEPTEEWQESILDEDFEFTDVKVALDDQWDFPF